MADRKLIKKIEVRQVGEDFALLIDGEEFPWYITEGGIRTHIAQDCPPSITITLLANTVEVLHSWSADE